MFAIQKQLLSCSILCLINYIYFEPFNMKSKIFLFVVAIFLFFAQSLLIAVNGQEANAKPERGYLSKNTPAAKITEEDLVKFLAIYIYRKKSKLLSFRKVC